MDFMSTRTDAFNAMPARWRANRGTASKREFDGEGFWMSGMDICPEKSISKRSEDGIVVVNQGKCIGCRSCSKACPYHIPQYGKTGVMQKCDLCLERLGQGKQPSCVATCPGEALKFGTIDVLAEMAIARGGKLSAPTEPAFFISGRMTVEACLGLVKETRAHTF
jgi:Fe-S-cluster-containing dehydrogenase component